MFKLYINLVLCLIVYVHSFPSGAPPESCDSLSPERGHKALSQPVEYAPFSVVASTNKYRPGQRIAVEIFPRIGDQNFSGFLVQALDASTHQPVGKFVGAEGMRSLKECSAVSHANSKPKRAVNLVWEAPHDRNGEVLFRATIVQKKQLYYSNILAYTADEYYRY